VLHALLADWSARGAAAILALQGLSSPVLDAVMILITMLGQEPFVALLYAVSFWCWGKRWGLRAAGLLLASLIVNEILKRAVAEPRPFVTYPAIVPRVAVASLSFPSGHAQTSAAFWSTVAWRARRRAVTAVCAAIVLLVSFSRVYLGVHYPHDVIGGIVVGLAVAAAWAAALRWLNAALPAAWHLRAAVAGMEAGMAVYAALRQWPAGAALGVALGSAYGWLLEERRLGARPAPGRGRCLARIALGLALLGALGAGIGVALPSSPALAAGLLGAGGALGLTWGVPWLFVRLGLMQARPAEPPA